MAPMPDLVPQFRGGGNFLTHLKAATDPIVAIAAFGDLSADEFAEQTLQSVAHLGMVDRGRGKRATVGVDEVTPILMLHLA
jgi:hypothetical protein